MVSCMTLISMVHDCEACISNDNLVEWKRIRPRTLFTLSNAADTNLTLKIDEG